MLKITVGTINVTPKAKKLINQALDSNRISMGKLVASFEDKFAAYHGVRECVAVSTGTDACTIALSVYKDFNEPRNREVLVPALTFVY